MSNSHQELASSQSHAQQPVITVGYYDLRGKAQVPRLLLEYLGVEYLDRKFTIAEWQRFSQQSTKDFAFKVLPFLREGDFVCTDSVPMCTYIINRFGNPDLLGKNLHDRAVIEEYFWTIPFMENVIAINCQKLAPEQLRKYKEKQWKNQVYPRIRKIQEAVSKQGWFLGYLSIIDFSIYELIRYMDNIFDQQIKYLPKMKKIQTMFSNLPAIKDYEQSPRAVTEWNPANLLASYQAMMAQKEKKEKQEAQQLKKIQQIKQNASAEVPQNK